MRERIVKQFECSICGNVYGNADSAIGCEERGITHNRNVKEGDTVRILNGQDSGSLATVTKVFIYDKYWGHYAWERYWHTVGLVAKIKGGYASRQLTFDDYEVIERR
jgi:hypothetical protein